jgi:4-hydroxybenzoate polyprenyltransferase
MTRLRTLLVLGRVSNLPTVWSNCLAGWWLSGGGSWERFSVVCLGATCLYLGGMYLNDAFDAQFDQQHRPERPIPAGAIRSGDVWAWGVGWLLAGLACLFVLNPVTIILALLLAFSIVVYDAIHKIFAFSSVLMGVCRLLLVLVAASAGRHGVTGLAVWSALVLGCYVVGLSYLARKESVPTALRYWPCVLLIAPFLLAFVVNRGENQLRAALVGSLLAIWILRSLRFAYWSAQQNIGRSVAGLLAAIVLVDWLSVWEGEWPQAVAFVAMFALALVFQRFVPAT